MSPLIRPATPSDLSDLAGLEADCFGAGAWTIAQLAPELHRARAVAWLALQGERAVGYLLGWADEVEGELTRVGVRPGAQGQGLGLSLLRALEDEAQDRGAARLFLEVHTHNTPARRLYERAGWSTRSLRDRYYADGGAAVIMERTLDPRDP